MVTSNNPYFPLCDKCMGRLIKHIALQIIRLTYADLTWLLGQRQMVWWHENTNKGLWYLHGCKGSSVSVSIPRFNCLGVSLWEVSDRCQV